MFNSTFDLVLAAILAVLAVVFFLGKGKGILDAFGGRSSVNEKKRTPEQELKYQRVIALFLIILAVNEAIMGLFAHISKAIPLITMGIVFVVFVLVIIYMKKNF